MAPGWLERLPYLNTRVDEAPVVDLNPGYDVAMGIDMSKQASELSKELPRDMKLLRNLVYNDRLPLDIRGKVLEVMIFRGATNDYAYDQMHQKILITNNMGDLAEWTKREVQFKNVARVSRRGQGPGFRPSSAA